MLTELRLDERRPGIEPLAEAVLTHHWIRPMMPPDCRAIPGLGEGESAAIQLAERLRCPLLIDERRGRIAAKNRSLEIVGTGRVLIAVKEKNLIDSVGGVLDALKASGYRLSEMLCSRLLRIAKER